MKAMLGTLNAAQIEGLLRAETICWIKRNPGNASAHFG